LPLAVERVSGGGDLIAAGLAVSPNKDSPYRKNGDEVRHCAEVSRHYIITDGAGHPAALKRRQRRLTVVGSRPLHRRFSLILILILFLFILLQLTDPKKENKYAVINQSTYRYP
jgi:hypothetical protein